MRELFSQRNDKLLNKKGLKTFKRKSGIPIYPLTTYQLLLETGWGIFYRASLLYCTPSPSSTYFSLSRLPHGNSEHFPQNSIQIWSLDMYVLEACNSWHTSGGFKEYLPAAGLEAARPARSCRIWRSTSPWSLLPSESRAVQSTPELWNRGLS